MGDSNKRPARSTRRTFIKTAGAAGAVGLAGCTSGDGDGGSNGDGGSDSGGSSSGGSSGGSGSSGGNTAGSSGETDKPLNGVSFKYWSIINAQSRAARSFLEDLVAEFEADTGASVEVNWSAPSEAIGTKWLQGFKSGNQPHVTDFSLILSGQFASNGWLKPLNDMIPELVGEDRTDQIEWINPIVMERNYAGYDGEIYGLPFSYMPRAPFIGRMDYLEEAGYNPDKDWPPSDHDTLIAMAKDIQANTDAQWGYQVHGAQGDVTDCQHMQWAVSEDATKGNYLNEDWSDTNVDNEVWKTATRRYVEAFTEHEVSPPNTAATSDEEAVPRIISGSLGMTQADFYTHAEYLEQAPDLMEDGTIRWGPAYGGPANQRSMMTWQGISLVEPPEDADTAKWERSQEAAIEFAKRFYQDGVQQSVFDWLGTVPTLNGYWEGMPRGEHKMVESAITMAENTDSAVPIHERITDIMFNLPAPHVQQAFQGEISPEEANDKWAADVRQVL